MASSVTEILFSMDSKRSSIARAGLHTRRAGPKSMTKSSTVGRRTMPHWMARRSLPDSSNSMRAFLRASMVSLKSISEGWTLSEDKGLNLRLTDGARDVGPADALICYSGATAPGSTLTKPIGPPPLHVGVAQEEDH